MLYVRFIRNFVLHTVLTSLNEDGKYDVQEFNYPVREDLYVWHIESYSESTPDSWSIDFNGAGNIQGSAINVLKNHVEIFDSNGNPNPPPTPGKCCKD